jgi:hypothetical protein
MINGNGETNERKAPEAKTEAVTEVTAEKSEESIEPDKPETTL